MKTPLTIPVWLFTLAMGSCTHYYYVQNIHNVPLFKEKNEIRATAAIGLGSEVTTTEIQAAYSFADNLGAMVDYVSLFGGDRLKNNYGKGYYMDGAIGYFKPIQSHGIFEIYGGVGTGSQQHHYPSTGQIDNTANLSFTKIFIQPSFGLTTNMVDIALSSRISNLHFNNISNRIAKNYSEFTCVNDISQNRNSVLLEPALTLRTGWKYLKLQAQYSISENMSNPNLKFEKSTISLGLYISIAKRYWERRDKYAVNKK